MLELRPLLPHQRRHLARRGKGISSNFRTCYNRSAPKCYGGGMKSLISRGALDVRTATGGSLLDRVRRLLGQPCAEFGYRSATPWLVAVGLVSLALATGDAQQHEGGETVSEGVENREAPAAAERVKASPLDRSINADARVRFLAIERFARLPIAEQAKRLPQFYRNLDARTLSIIVEGILSSYPHDILKGYQQDDPVVSRNSIPTEPADAQ